MIAVPPDKLCTVEQQHGPTIANDLLAALKAIREAENLFQKAEKLEEYYDDGCNYIREELVAECRKAAAKLLCKALHTIVAYLGAYELEGAKRD